MNLCNINTDLTIIRRKQKIRCIGYSVIAFLLTFASFSSMFLQTDKPEQIYIRRYVSRKLLQTSNEVSTSPKLLQGVNNNSTSINASKIVNTNKHTEQSSSSTPTSNTSHSENQTCLLPSVAEFPNDFMTSLFRKNGGLLIHLFVALYMFLGLALICDYYFVASLEVICQKLKIQSDVAGASLMAIGSSAPELFASLIGVFVTKGDIGIGTILGSAVFNVLFVLGLSALITSKRLDLAWWPVTRDTLCYAVTLICLATVIVDGFVTWIEALIMLILYAGYLILMWTNNRIEKWYYLYVGDKKTYAERFEKIEELEEKFLEKKEEVLQWSEDEEDNSDENIFPTDPPRPLCAIPLKWNKKLEWIVCLPLNTLFFFTIPDVRRHNFRDYYILTFITSISWIGFLTYILTWMVTIIGFTFSIPDTVMGLTFLAFGSSLPDALASICVARQGKGDMAVAQALGSNVFDILFGLGLPWLIKTLIFDLDSTIEVQSVGMLISCFTIFVLVLLTLLALYHEKFILSRKLGVGLLITYALFLIVSVLLEIQIWSKYHLPTCKLSNY